MSIDERVARLVARRVPFAEFDRDHGAPFGTAIPLRRLHGVPPTEDESLLEWLAEREAENRAEIDEAWRAVLGR